MNLVICYFWMRIEVVSGMGGGFKQKAQVLGQKMQHDGNMITKTSYLVYTYSLFVNVDNSVLGLNPIIDKFGYQFVSINLQDFEKSFSHLVSLPKDFQSERNFVFADGKHSVSQEFCELILNHQSFGHSALKNKAIILLQRIKDFEQEVIKNTVSVGLAMQVASELQDFSYSLIQQLRLHKNGDIACPIEFQIIKDSRRVSFRSLRQSKFHGHANLKLTSDDVIILSKTLTEKFVTNQLTELAINNFNLSYEISDLKTRYITLMTCLESLMNLGPHQITHTVSRHLALVISKSVNEFQLNYTRIKQLYDIRSNIVHGGTISEDLAKVTNELHDKVRHAINYCIKLDIDKKSLFEKLNALGFGLQDDKKTEI